MAPKLWFNGPCWVYVKPTRLFRPPYRDCLYGPYIGGYLGLRCGIEPTVGGFGVGVPCRLKPATLEQFQRPRFRDWLCWFPWPGFLDHMQGRRKSQIQGR